MLSALFHAKNVNLDGSSQRCIFSDDPVTPFDSSSSVVTWRRTDGITGIPPPSLAFSHAWLPRAAASMAQKTYTKHTLNGTCRGVPVL